MLNIKKKYDNIAVINDNITKFADFKKILIDFLNHNPIINFNSFKQKSIEYYMKNNYEFNVSKNTFKNIFYSWRRNSKLFSWYSIFDNSYTKDRTLYLKDVSNSYIYNSKGYNMYWHRHIIWVSNYNIKRIRYSLHYYLDATYASSK